MRRLLYLRWPVSSTVHTERRLALDSEVLFQRGSSAASWQCDLKTLHLPGPQFLTHKLLVMGLEYLFKFLLALLL